MGEAKRRKQLDPNYGKPTETKLPWESYEITEPLIEKVRQCKRKYGRGFVFDFIESIEIDSRSIAQHSQELKAVDKMYSADDVVVVALVKTGKKTDTLIFPWRPDQIVDRRYRPNDVENVILRSQSGRKSA